LIKSKMRSR